MISFCIITNGRDPDLLEKELESIHSQRIQAYEPYEIIVCGVTQHIRGTVNAKIPYDEAAAAGRLGAMRNTACRESQGEILVVSDDDMYFTNNWYRGVIAYPDPWDVLCGRIINPDGSRYWDWATHGGPRGHRVLPYNETSPDIYVTGGLCVMKRNVFDMTGGWNEQKGLNQEEDVEFSSRVKAAGFSIRFNVSSTVIHMRPSWGTWEQG